MLKPRRSEPPLVCWLSGATGVGKTRAAIELADELAPDNYWISPGSLQWFDGYAGEPVVIFDDLRTKHASFHFLLRLLDRYALRVPFKGGFVDWTPLIIIITAPYSPTRMWDLRCTEDLQQLQRRCHLVHDASEGDDHTSFLTMLREAVNGRWPGGVPWREVLEDQAVDHVEGGARGADPQPVDEPLPEVPLTMLDVQDDAVLTMANNSDLLDEVCVSRPMVIDLTSESEEVYDSDLEDSVEEFQ